MEREVFPAAQTDLITMAYQPKGLTNSLVVSSVGLPLPNTKDEFCIGLTLHP